MILSIKNLHIDIDIEMQFMKTIAFMISLTVCLNDLQKIKKELES